MVSKRGFGALVFVGILCQASDDLEKLTQTLYALSSQAPTETESEPKKTLSRIDKLFEQGELVMVGEPILTAEDYQRAQSKGIPVGQIKALISTDPDATLRKIRVPKQSGAECVANAMYNCLVLTMALSAPDNRVEQLLSYFTGTERASTWAKFKEYLLTEGPALGIVSMEPGTINWLPNDALDRLMYAGGGNIWGRFVAMVEKVGFPQEMLAVGKRVFDFRNRLYEAPKNMLEDIGALLRELTPNWRTPNSDNTVKRVAQRVYYLTPTVFASEMLERTFNLMDAVYAFEKGAERAVIGFTLSAGGHNTAGILVREHPHITILVADSLSDGVLNNQEISALFTLPESFGNIHSIESDIVRLISYQFYSTLSELKTVRAATNQAKWLGAFNTHQWASKMIAADVWPSYRDWMREKIQAASLADSNKQVLLNALA